MHIPWTLTVTAALAMSTSTSTTPHAHRLHGINTSQPAPHVFPFTLRIPPNTDLWSKPGTPAIFSHNQPSFGVSVPLRRFARASVTLKLAPEVLYDQAGLVVLFGKGEGRGADWIKAGVEFVPELGGLKKSVVATRAWSDWSTVGAVGSGESVLVGIEREVVDGVKGPGMVFKVGGETVREVTWAYVDDEGEESDEDVWVGFYGARPAKVGELEACIEDWEIKFWK